MGTALYQIPLLLGTFIFDLSIWATARIVLTPADLGLTVGGTIYGYSLMAMDVTATTSAQTLDWTNAAFYPTTTDGTTGGGGIDLAGLNGIAFSVVPEAAPSAAWLGAFALLATACHFARARRRRNS
jgi:hypothetical protein